jgi:hypothetical protein
MTLITRAQPRENVRVTLNDGLVIEGPVGTTIEQFLLAANKMVVFDSPIMGGILDSRLRELSYSVMRDAEI